MFTYHILLIQVYIVYLCMFVLLQGEFLVNAGSFGITTTISGMSNVSIRDSLRKVVYNLVVVVIATSC